MYEKKHILIHITGIVKQGYQPQEEMVGIKEVEWS